ncbi:nonribosomal siderophore peptide synthase SidC [Aspergillus candidus]|uniref:Nonribosomal peptide synthetase sidC n=1 Tax=Aspergillus candidus TaxID=41067 RepID=A0A2I2EZV8_ASPCN|nr:non-ribosomal peptide synthetase/alpha-aminoadipate reductase [Aspergillus candidus]PLB33914.1 non-ribosomal peptide synthetase/alpha-aminoadipate reductase [Aspergillus candidus]
MAGAIFNHEEHESPAHASPQPNGHHTPVAMEIFPITRIPALDTIDPYAVARPACDAVAESPRIELSCSRAATELIDDLVQGYARFISNFTGLEDVAFGILRRATWQSTSNPATAVISASVFWSEELQAGEPNNCKVREINQQDYNKDEIQFSLELGLDADPENGEHQICASGRGNVFTLHADTVANNNALQVSFSYPKPLIPDPAVNQLLNTLATHLANSSPSLNLVASTPDLSILNFPPLMIPPTRKITEDVEPPSSRQPSLLHAAFEGWARRKPNAIALDFVHSLPSATGSAEHSILTYAALNVAASNLAVHIRAQLSVDGQVPEYGRIIPVYMTTSPELYISYLAILKAGCAFSPIPQDAPEQRVREILEEINSPIILGNVSEPAAGPWRPIDSQDAATGHVWIDVVEVSRWKEMRGDAVLVETIEPPEPLDIHEDQVAYLLFTSGSTGKPKGVQIHHLAATCSIESHATAIPLPGDSIGDFRWFQFASPTFDPSLMEIFVTLSSGATLCSAHRHLTLTDLEATVNEAKATVMMATPSLAALLRPSHLTTLQSLWTMGEKLNRTVIENFSPKSGVNASGSAPEPARMLVNAYGPTEGAINCTFLAPFEYSTRGSIIGEALPTCAMLVLDPNSHLPKAVPAGLAGELAIAGPQVGKGYLNRPKETAKSFVHSPEFGPVYRTGDMARIVWDESGSQIIEFLGRITSDQVKISGRRVELGEIESVLATVGSVTEAVAIVSKRDNDVQGSEQIIACLVANGLTETQKQELIHQAHQTTHQHLSSYMCPSVYAFVDTLPRSSSGKVDRKAIADQSQTPEAYGVKFYRTPKPELSDVAQSEWEMPEDEETKSTQQLVIRLIADTVEEDASAIRPNSDLYSLGLDSLGAMRFLQNLRDNAIESLSVGDVLQAGTPKGLVATIHKQNQMNGSVASGEAARLQTLQESLAQFSDRNRLTCAERLGVTPEKISDVLPTTATQSGMLTSFLRSSANSAFTTRSYIYHSVFPLESGVDVGRLQQAWDTVVASYDSFQTVFSLIDDDLAPFAQCVLVPGAVSKSNWDVYTADHSEEESLREACRNAEETIDLTVPPWKLSLVTSPKRSTIVLSMFHGIFDGGSLQLLLEDVSSVYDGRPLGKRTSLEYTVKQHFGADQDATAEFWKSQLEGHIPVAFPTVTPNRSPSLKTSHRVETTARISYDSLKKQSKSIGSTPLAVLQAAWASVLLAYSGTPDQDVVLGSVVSGRLDTESEVCIGPTFNIIPVRLALNQVAKDAQGSWTNRSVARHLTSLNAKTISHLQPPLGAVATADGRLPYDTLLIYQDFNAGSRASGLWTSIDNPPMANEFAVMIEVWPEVDSSLTLRATFNDTHIDHHAAEIMLKQMSDIVDYFLESPEANFHDASSQTQIDLKSSFNPNAAVASEALEGALLHTWFEDHADTHPDDVALLFKGNLDDENDPSNISWTYGQLNAMADDLADHLLQISGPLINSPIPICIDKSPVMYVAILGILKAGGAWCPIDTFSPSQRRHDLIARTEANFLLVSSQDPPQPEDAIPTGVEMVDVSRFCDENAAKNSQKRNSTKHRSNPDSMAYLIWTSGTTGAPKGVPITHAAGVSCMKSLHKDIPTDVQEGAVRCMQFSQYTFDVSIQDFFYTWGIGGVLISASREIMLGSYAKLANVTKATHAHLTPAFAANVPRKACETLKVITMIGEKLTQPVADDWGTDMRAFNTYGPAEVTIVSTIREFGNEHKAIKSANIGWPMDTVSVFVTKNQRMVMKNAVGELALGGPQISPGYLKQEDVTKAKYVWNDEASQVLYYTGDLVRMLSDGSLEYINRVDDQIKIGGIRVELSEITFALNDCHTLVENIETMVLNRPDRPVQVVVAFLSAPGAVTVEDDEGELSLVNDTALGIARATRDKAMDSLPSHMIPSAYIVVKNIPRTQSAKTDRRALQQAYTTIDIETWDSRLNPENLAAEESFDADSADAATASKIVDIVATLTNIAPSVIAPSTRLRSLGLDSLRAIRLTGKLKDNGFPLSVVEVLNCVTVQDLVKLANCSSGTEDATITKFDLNQFHSSWHGVASEKVHDKFSTVRATTLQESLISETMGTYDMYWSNHFFSLDQSVDLSRLRQAWIAACQTTEALRTGFIPVAELDSRKAQDGLDFAILQLIYKLPNLDWEEHTCTGQDWTAVRDQRIKDIMTKHQNNYFRNPPWGVTVFDNGDERIMVLTLHHAIHDEPSLRFIMENVQSAYTSEPPSRRQLSDALSILLPTETRSRDTRAFWKTELEKFSDLDVPVWPDLTGKRVQPDSVQEYNLMVEEIPLSVSSSRLQSVAASLGVSSVASIIRAAWAYVSLSYLGLPATVFAETLSDRVLHPDLEDGVGPLISVVPVPFHPEGSAREVLAEQQRLSSQTWKHRHIHAREVRKMLQRPRGEPLYPAVFNFQVMNEETQQSSQSTMWRELEDLIGLHVEHPMALNVFQHTNDAIVVEAWSDSRIMSRDQLAIFVRQVDSLVSSMLQHPEKPLNELVNYVPQSLRSLSSRPVSDEVKNSVYSSPTHWLEHYAKEQPDWVALEVASKIAPEDENLPADRKAFLVEDGDCPMLFTENPFMDSFNGIPDGCRTILIDGPEFHQLLEPMSPETQDYQSHPDDNSYLLFTSGSTGKPKGVMVTRGNLSSFIESFSEFCCRVAPATLKLGGTGKYLAQANRAFDPHLLEMLFPWRHGMATATAPRPMILDDLQTTLSKWEITHASFVPSLVDQASLSPENCPKLKFMTVGGEKISKRVLDTWAVNPYTSLVNAYGPTEVTIGCTFAHVGKDTNLRNIGPPLPACVCHVLIPGTLDYALRGQTGELCFSGDIVAKGYLNRPDAGGFTPGPNGEKMYRTGDIGRLMVDDSVEYLGRGDDQTKIRGQRLELGEVSEVLRSASSIGVDVVTTVAKHPGLARVQLISFIARSGTRQREKNEKVAIVQSDFATLGKDLQTICQKKLPGYMVPEIVLPITYIPLAPLSGKANVKDLHALFAELPLQTVLLGNSSSNTGDDTLSRPLTSDESAVVQEICKVVSTDASAYSPMTNIFEMGVDSLSAIGLSIKLRRIGYAATVALVMSNPIVEQLARLPRSSSSTTDAASSKLREIVQEMDSQYRENAPAGVDLSAVSSVRPCLPLQEGLVARSMNNDGDNLYVNHVVLKLEEHVDAKQLKSAWQTVATDNEIMRTAFAPLDKQMAQVVFSADLHQIRWTEETYHSLEEALEKKSDQQASISRDIISSISQTPPVRFQLAKSAGTEQPLALFISIHHALYDGESFSMLLEDVAARYAAESVPERGSPSAFIEHIYSQDQSKAQQHWAQHLADCHPTTFRDDFNVMEHPKPANKLLSTKLSELERRSASLHTTVPNLVQAVFALLLADTVGVSDLTYGLVLSGRAVSVPGAESVLLPCITTIPGRLNTSDLDTVNEVVGAVQKSTVKSLDFQHTSLRHIQRWLKSETPLFDCLFSYIRSTAPPKHNLWSELDSHMPAEYPLAVEVEANHDKDIVSLNCLFSSAFGAVHDGEEFIEKMDTVISSVVAGESLSLDSFNLSQSHTSGSRPSAIKWDETTWSATEEKIRELTAEFCGLGAKDVSKGASFLSLGVDSVTAIQFARKLREAALEASSSDVMRFSCVGALAKHINEASAQKPQSNGVVESSVAQVPVDAYQKHVRLLSSDDSVVAMFESTPLQSGMITQTIASTGQVYVYPHPIRLATSTDASKLKTALFQVIEANDILRTSFHLIEELGTSWIGAVHSNPPFEWKEIELPSGADILHEVSSLYSFSEESSFQVPPIRSTLVSQPEGRLLVVTLHHALYDGASIPFFFEDLARFYDGEIPVERPPFSQTVQHVLSGQEESCEFWVNKLRGYEVVEMPELPATEASDRMLLSEYRVDLDLDSIVESCKKMEVTVQSVSLLAYSKVLGRLIGKRDVVFGQVLAGRSLPTPEAERTLGPLFNTVAHRVTFEPKFLSNKAMARSLQEMTNDAQIYQHAPLRTVQNSLRQSGDLKSASLFDTLFVFQKSADFAGSILEEQKIWTPYESDDYAAQAEYKLNLEVDHARDGIVVRSTCNGLYLSQEALDGLMSEFGAVFKDIVDTPARCATTFPEQLKELPLRVSQEQPSEQELDTSDAPAQESVVHAVLADVSGLPLDKIKPSTSIFSIGLDSLSAIRIASICRSKGLKASVADILQGNTLRGISQRIKPMPAQTATPQGPLIDNYTEVEEAVLKKLNIKKEAVDTILPCLGGQFFHLVGWLKSGRRLLEPAWPYFSTERLDNAKLEDAWFKLRQRHPVLRTCFAATSPNDAVQIVMKHTARGTSTFKVIQTSSSIAEAAKAQAKEEAARPSSLYVPPVRLCLLKASDRDGILIIVNHAAYDAWTMPMFVSELVNIYRNEPLEATPDFRSFVDFSVRSLRDLDEKTYWSSVVDSGVPTVIKKSQPTNDDDQSSLLCSAWDTLKRFWYPASTEDTNKSDQLFVGAWEKVKNLSQMESACRAAGLSLQTVVLLAVARALGRMTGVESPIMGLYQTGRSASFADIEKLSGPCLNVNPLVIPNAISDHDGSDPSLLEKAQSVQSSLAERVSFEQSSIMDVLRWNSTKNNGGPLFNAWVNLLWMQNGVPSSADTNPGADTEKADQGDLFLPLRIGVPTDFIPAQPLPGLESTSVSALDTSLLPDENVFIDIGPDPKTDTIGFGIRVEGGVMDESEVNQMVSDIGAEIERIVGSLH